MSLRLFLVTAALTVASAAAAETPVAARAVAAAPGGFTMADAAYDAFAKKDWARAAAMAAEAVKLEPGRREYRQLLVQAYANAGRGAEAETAAADLEARFGEDAEVEAQRAYLATARGDAAVAADHFAKALSGGKLSPASERLVRLGLFDALISMNRPAEALAPLEGVADPEGYDVQSRRAIALAAVNRPEQAAIAEARAASLAPDAASRAYMTRARVMALVAQQKTPEAARIFADALKGGALDASDPVDLAMVAVAVGDDATALVNFDKARQAGQLTGRAALDAAYAAKRLGRDPAAVDYFKIGLDRARAGEFALTPQAEFEIRRDVASISRRWGAQGYLGYGPTSAVAGAASPSRRSVTQAGVEAYDRIGGYDHGATLDVFGRAFETVADRRGDPTGPETLQGWIGLRKKPLADQNLVLEGSRMIKLGRLARNDWMLRAAYSAGEGQDLRLDRGSWPMWSVYADAAHLLDAGETLAVFEARAGRSTRLDQVDGHVVVSPFLGLAAAYDSALASDASVGAGPGLAVRQWLREDAYDAPRSYIDLALQYRFRLSGDNREKGLFATLSLAY